MSNEFLTILLSLLTAHFAGDFLCQTNRQADEKLRNPKFLIQHSLIVAILSYILCGYWNLWQVPVAIFITHASLDYLKTATKAKSKLGPFLLDQIGHVLIILFIAITFSPRKTIYCFWFNLWGISYLKVLLLASSFILTIWGGAIFIGLAVKPFLDQLEEARKKEKSPLENRGFEGGGCVIGQLERSLILLLVLANQIGAIGFLIAAKSIFRFGELKDPKNRMEAEYIIIGTLLSFTFALITGYLTHFFLLKL